MVQPAGGGVPVHPGAAAVAQDRAGVAVADGAVDGAGDGWWQRDEDDLAAFAEDAQDAVAVFLAEVVDVGAGGFEDPQAEQAEQARPGRSRWGWSRCGRRRACASNCRWVSPSVGDSAGTLGRRTCSAGECVEDGVDDAGAVEPGDDGDAPADTVEGL